MFETILLVGNGALSSSLQKFLKKERVVVFDKDNIDHLIHTKGDLLIDCSLPDAFDSVYAYLKNTDSCDHLRHESQQGTVFPDERTEQKHSSFQKRKPVLGHRADR